MTLLLQRWKGFVLAGVSLALLFANAQPAAAKSGPCKNNKKPVIHSLTPDQPQPYPGESVHITSSITDVDSTIASYEWKANGMSWQAGGPSWTYTVPADKHPGSTINVHLKVRDTCGKVAQAHVKLNIVENPDDAEDPEGEGEDDDEVSPANLPTRLPPAKSLRMTLSSTLTGPKPSLGSVVDWTVDSPERQKEIDRLYARRLKDGQISVTEEGEDD